MKWVTHTSPTTNKNGMYIWLGTQQERDYMKVPSEGWGDVKIHLKESEW
jgi:hypothetical protein